MLKTCASAGGNWAGPGSKDSAEKRKEALGQSRAVTASPGAALPLDGIRSRGLRGAQKHKKGTEAQTHDNDHDISELILHCISPLRLVFGTCPQHTVVRVSGGIQTVRESLAHYVA